MESERNVAMTTTLSANENKGIENANFQNIPTSQTSGFMNRASIAMAQAHLLQPRLGTVRFASVIPFRL